MTMVEKVARAIAPYAWNDAFWQTNGREKQYDRNQRHVQQTALREARAAIEAMREPTEAMLKAAWNMDPGFDDNMFADGESHWTAMIYASLNEKTPAPEGTGG